jgi:hypothetical protein
MLTVVSCGGSNGGQKSSSRAISVKIPTVNVAAACTPGYNEIALSPENPTEAWLAPSLRVCAQPTRAGYSLQVINAGPAVWVVDGLQWLKGSLDDGPWEVKLFRQGLAGKSDLAVEPDRSATANVTYAFVRNLHLHLDLTLQSAWEIASRTVGAMKSKMKTFILTKFSPEVRAGIRCVEAGYDAADQLTALSNSSDPADILDRAYKATTGVKQCKSAIDEARNAAEKNGRPALTVEDFRVSAIRDETAVARSGESMLTALRNGLKTLFKAR